jgi:non-ribosomal peptide synthetase component F
MTDTAKFDLLLNLEETRDGLSAALQYNADLFEDSTSARILDRYHTLLNLIVERPETRLRDLVESLLEEDKHERLDEKSWLKSLRQRKLKNIKRKVIGEAYGEIEQ